MSQARKSVSALAGRYDLCQIAPAPYLEVSVRFSFTLVAVLLWLGPSLAQAGPEGRFAAAALAEYRTDATLRIELLDDKDLNLRLLADLEKELAAVGREVTGTGDYELSFETREITDLAGEATLGSLNVDTLRGVDLRLNLWSTTEDSLLVRRRRARSPDPLLRLDITVRDTTDGGRVVWFGRSEVQTRSSDQYRFFRQMLQAMVDNIGDNVEEEPIFLR